MESQKENESEIKIQVLSDLHFGNPLALTRFRESVKLKTSGEILVLAGDIGKPNETLIDFLKEVSLKWELIIFVIGNHEFYGGEYFSVRKEVKEICDRFENVECLDRSSLVRKGIRYVGCTLWSWIPDNALVEVSSVLNDYKKIKIDQKLPNGAERSDPDVMALETREIHKKEVLFIRREIEEAEERKERVVVITHHAPFRKGSSNPMYDEDLVSHAFSTDLTEMFNFPVVAWIYGHTHYSTRVEINGIPCVSNQLGYILNHGVPERFDPNYVLKVKIEETKNNKEEDEGEKVD